MKQGLLWLIGGIAIGAIIVFLLNMTIPSRSVQFNTAPKCGEPAYWDYCVNGQMCHTECNACSCQQPTCHQSQECVPINNSSNETPSTTEEPPAPPKL